MVSWIATEGRGKVDKAIELRLCYKDTNANVRKAVHHFKKIKY